MRSNSYQSYRKPFKTAASDQEPERLLDRVETSMQQYCRKPSLSSAVDIVWQLETIQQDQIIGKSHNPKWSSSRLLNVWRHIVLRHHIPE